MIRLIRASNALLALSLLSLASVTACSSSISHSVPGAGVGTPPAAFSKYCTGTLKKSFGVLFANGPGEWAGSDAVEASSGATFLVSADFGQWGGYMILQDGSPGQIDAGFTGLVLGTDFTSSCAPSAPPTQSATHFVLLAPVTLYATSAMTGTACTFPAGTELTQASYTSDGSGPAQVASPEIAAKCGTSAPMYSNDVAFGDLVGL